MFCSIDDIVPILRIFVTEICVNRDDSHNQVHMEDVYNTSMMIFDREIDTNNPNYDETRKLTIIVSWLHDVFDHKYDKDGGLKKRCCDFLSNVLGLSDIYINIVISIIDNISYSKEDKKIKEGICVNFEEMLGKYAIIRHIVSDADKIQAIGDIGIIRCAQYNIEHSDIDDKNNIDIEELKTKITDHYEEKLCRLYNEFIRTETGKKICYEHHIRTIEIINNLHDFLIEHMHHIL